VAKLGRPVSEKPKSSVTMHIKLHPDFESEMREAHESGPMRSAPLNAFAHVLMEYGLGEYKRQERAAAEHHAQKDEPCDDSKRAANH
jgi:hypothetical protein